MRAKVLTKNDGFRVVEAFVGANAAFGTGTSSFTWVSDGYYEVVEVRETHAVAATDGGGATLTVEKLTGTLAPGAGANMFKTSTINLKGTANTPQRIQASTLTSLSVAQRAAQQVTPGDRIGLTVSAATTLAGMSVTLVLRQTRPNRDR